MESLEDVTDCREATIYGDNLSIKYKIEIDLEFSEEAIEEASDWSNLSD